MSNFKFQIRQSPDKAKSGKRFGASDLIKLLGAQEAPAPNEAQTADKIEELDEESSPTEAQEALSPKTPAAVVGKHVGSSPSTDMGGKSAQRSFLTNISQDIAFQKPHNRPAAQRAAQRTAARGSMAARLSSLPSQAIGCMPDGRQSFTITSTQPEANILKCLCTPLAAPAFSEQVILLLKISLCRSLSTSTGAALTISKPWTELPPLPGCPPILVPWLITNAV